MAHNSTGNQTRASNNVSRISCECLPAKLAQSKVLHLCNRSSTGLAASRLLRLRFCSSEDLENQGTALLFVLLTFFFFCTNGAYHLCRECIPRQTEISGESGRFFPLCCKVVLPTKFAWLYWPSAFCSHHFRGGVAASLLPFKRPGEEGKRHA